MSLPIVFRADARAEYDDAADWYEQHRPGEGAAFTDAVQSVLDLLSAQPRMHAVVLRGVRKARVPNYPYCVYYRDEPTQLVVVSVFHTSRDPAAWQSRA